MTKKAKHEDSSGAFYGHSDLKHRINDPYQEIDGYAGTRYGYVSAFSRGTPAHGATYLYMTIDGREYCRYFDRLFTARGLITKARQFAADLHRES